MELQLGSESRNEYLEFELALGARKLVEEVMLVKPSETVVITGDTSTDWRVVEATARAAYVAGASPTIVKYESRPRPVMEPPAPVAGAIRNADVWIEFAVAYLLHSKAYKEAVQAGARYICLGGVDTDLLVRAVARVDFQKLLEFSEKFCEVMQGAETVRITCSNGTGVIKGRPVRINGRPAREKGATVFLGGQITWNPIESTITGVMAYDGTVWPPTEIGQLKEPVKLQIEKGIITKFEGGPQAKLFEKWMKAFNDPNMFRIAHYSPGFNPGVSRTTGRLIEDERFFGCMVIGMGSQGKHTAGSGWDAATHTDGIILHPSLWADETPVQENGFFIHPKLAPICRKMGVLGY
jgi:leucyl aminopeptidase (aminopeptidase T)